MQLIIDFLDNLRAFTAETPAEFTVEALRPILREAVELALSHVERPAAGIDVRQAVDDPLKLEANRSRLLQAVINIIVNAVKACANQTRPGVLTISAEQQTDSHISRDFPDAGS